MQPQLLRPQYVGKIIRSQIIEPQTSIQTLTFNKTSTYVLLEASSDWDFATNDFSIGFWFNLAALNGFQMPFAIGRDITRRALVIGIHGFGGPRLWWSSTGSGWDINASGTGSPVSANVWHHFILNRISNTIYFYVDNAQVDSFDISSYPSLYYHATDSDVSIGCHLKTSGAQSYFGGLITNVVIYHRSLPTDEIAAFYENFQLVPDTQDLVGWLRFQEGFGVSNGTRIRDWSGQENHGSMQGFSGTPWNNIGVR